MAAVLTEEALGPPKDDCLKESGMVPSPNPPSVCPTEESSTSTASGAFAEQFSDVFSEADSDVSAPAAGRPEVWEDDVNSAASQPDRDGGHFRALLGAQAVLAPTSSCGAPFEFTPQASHDPGRALLEHYGVLGAASGAWRRAAPSPRLPEKAPPEDSEKPHGGAEEAHDEDGAAPSKRQPTSAWFREWRSLGQRLSRVLGEMQEEEDAA
eukprot:CAMPEP_0204511668 /NCGR_PEP_ID=MMETSP0661-20131031/552_1 /ASSEMBLY_ACC=CAM_ASM_000606 /TAXON_ID=109239 /ORGANISM="Alexandrium margalefi, Strain AMGDE01CS-322" /LENGTH=209 /DNA_ID=CAMNT_0051516759 /DNA_START=49 /DNA_END=678 /DNA_ORIENTATION=+